MIDIENAYHVFDSYVSNFNPEDGRIKMKIEHIKRVATLSRKIAQNLNLTEEQVHLAELIGIFHDIGRFKQVELYHTFSDRDSGINHAAYSIQVLYEDGLISDFHIADCYTTIIKDAVLNHNIDKISSSLSGDSLLFAKILRDADKLDIFYTVIISDKESTYWYPDFDCEKISSQILDEFYDEHYIDYVHISSNADLIATFFAYIYDFNFPFSLKYLQEKKYLEDFTRKVLKDFKSPIIHAQAEDLLRVCHVFLKQSC